ncbi:MAG: photosynthetic reaction center cytochrome c subunit [Burkholderiales bacterium]|nr:photosynthetic reaction center cytochrome c subunit [Burkholderiales bacterium]
MSNRLFGAGVALLAAALLAGCERPPVDTVQRGYRGTGMELVYNPRIELRVAEANQAPPVTPPADSDAGPKARDIYKNVPLLGHLSVAEFTRVMAAMTEWVSPEQGCNYCHDPAAMGEDSKYTKVVARRMIEMTQHINAGWKPHVAATGVTCYTCHRGKAVPLQVWFKAPPQDKRSDFIGDLAGQNQPMKMVGMSSLTYDPYSLYLLGDQTIGIGASTALPTGHVASILHTEETYGLMMHMSAGLGVNCTYCHNTRNFKSWEGSPPQRTTAWHGIRMARELNNDYLEPLTKTFPANRLGPLGDVAKVNCATCHQGVYKPMYGAPMAKNYPSLLVSAAAKVADGLPPPLAEPTRSVLYFGVGSATLEGEQAKGLTQLIATLGAKPTAKAQISGYHSAAGEKAANEKLAKDRAVNVRDAIVAGGIAPARVVLDKPLQVGANVSGEDPSARRVEVTVK